MVFVSLWGAVCLFLLGWWLIEKLRLRLFYDLHRVPTPAGALPFLGHVLQFPVTPRTRFTQWAMGETVKLGKIWKYSVGGAENVIVTDREFYESNIYGHGENNEPKTALYRPFQKLCGVSGVPNLFTTEVVDGKYKAFRKTIALAFSSGNLKKKFPSILEQAHKFADIVNKNVGWKSVDYQVFGVRYAFDNIGVFAYDVEFNSLKNGHPMLSALSYCTDECLLDAINPLRPFYRSLIPFLEPHKKHKAGFQTLYAEYQKLFDRLDMFGKTPDEEDRSIRACLMNLRNPLRNNEKATWGEMMSEFTIFTVGGTDTTGHEIGWIMMWIADNRDVQDKVYAELQAHGLTGPGARGLEYADLSKLTYLKMVIFEGLRMSPVLSTVMSRYIRKDMTIMGYRLPKGTNVSALIQAQNNAPWLWKNPDLFRPERWQKNNVAERGGKPGVQSTGKELWSFSSGVRSCIGQKLGMMELQTLFAVLLSKFTFELDPMMGGSKNAVKKAYNSLVLACDGGIWVKAALRSDDVLSSYNK